MQTIKLTSPVVKVNLHGNHLLLGSRDCHLTIYSLNIAIIPNKGDFSISKTFGSCTVCGGRGGGE